MRDRYTCSQKFAHRRKSEKATWRSTSATSVIAPCKFFDPVHQSAKNLVQLMRSPKGEARMIMLRLGENFTDVGKNEF